MSVLKGEKTKLYIYSFWGNKFSCREADVEEKPKTYKAVRGSFPNYYSTVRKDEVGQIKCDCLALVEPNFEYAKELFGIRAERAIADKLKRIEELKAELKIINESIIYDASTVKSA